MLTVLAIIYHFGPSFRQKFVAVTPAVFSVAVWLLGFCFRSTGGFGGAANYNKTFARAVASAVILLLFFYTMRWCSSPRSTAIDFSSEGWAAEESLFRQD
jgi:uncharacterized BrkB/YihY/UPF0761 family membrane protein